MGYSPWGCKESDTTERLHFSGARCLDGTASLTLVPEILSLSQYILESNLYTTVPNNFHATEVSPSKKKKRNQIRKTEASLGFFFFKSP